MPQIVVEHDPKSCGTHAHRPSLILKSGGKGTNFVCFAVSYMLWIEVCHLNTTGAIERRR